MIKYFLTLFLLLAASPVLACINCNPQVQDAIYNSQFYPNLLTMLSAFIVLGIIVTILSAISAKRYHTKLTGNPNLQRLTPVPFTTAAMVLGIGLGGFADGIVLHQVLQWHQMLSARVPATDYLGKTVNMFWDGIFHGFCLLLVIIGVVLLWKLLGRTDIDRSGKLLGGGLLLGWGLFNITEGVINHHILRLHNVLETATDHDDANYLFLGISVLILFVGFVLVNSIRRNRLIVIH